MVVTVRADGRDNASDVSRTSINPIRISPSASIAVPDAHDPRSATPFG
jgi:hypothetical protein